jgi:hypothetical protein
LSGPENIKLWLDSIDDERKAVIRKAVAKELSEKSVKLDMALLPKVKGRKVLTNGNGKVLF